MKESASAPGVRADTISAALGHMEMGVAAQEAALAPPSSAGRSHSSSVELEGAAVDAGVGVGEDSTEVDRVDIAARANARIEGGPMVVGWEIQPGNGRKRKKQEEKNLTNALAMAAGAQKIPHATTPT